MNTEMNSNMPMNNNKLSPKSNNAVLIVIFAIVLFAAGILVGKYILTTTESNKEENTNIKENTNTTDEENNTNTEVDNYDYLDTIAESMRSSARMIIDSAEREYAVRLALGTLDQTNDAIICTDVVDLSSDDFSACTLTFLAGGEARLNLYGATNGNFSGKCILAATSSSISVSTTCS